MGILDGLNKTIGTVNRTSSTVRGGMDAAKGAKQTTQAVGKVFEKKCKFCGKPLQTDAEKQKGVCASCALSRM